MKTINTYISEKLQLNKKLADSQQKYNYFPKTKQELTDILKELIKERGYKADLNDIDVSKIEDMSYVFSANYPNIKKFNGDISRWDTSKVKNMEMMFWSSNFNNDISIG